MHSDMRQTSTALDGADLIGQAFVVRMYLHQFHSHNSFVVCAGRFTADTSDGMIRVESANVTSLCIR